jgi:hypothetical protein
MNRLGRRVEVRNVDIESFGRYYAGRTGEITQVSQDEQTGVVTGYIVRMEKSGEEVPLKPEEVEILDL